LGFAVLGATRNPDRAFSVGITAVVAYSVVVFACDGPLEALGGSAGPVIPAALAALVLLALIRLVPVARPAHDALQSPEASARSQINGYIFVVGLGLWFGAPGVFWAFVGEVAVRNGISAAVLGAAFAVGTAVGFVGSLLPAIVATRWGRVAPIVISSVALCLATVACEYSGNVVSFTVALAAFSIFWNLGAVYQLALIAANDPSGLATARSPAAEVAGMAVGASLGGAFIGIHGYNVLAPVVLAFCAAGVAVYLLRREASLGIT
jgi:predicted MFS family arabinose efflux permease